MSNMNRIGSIALGALLLTGAATLPAGAQFRGLGNKLKSKAPH